MAKPEKTRKRYKRRNINWDDYKVYVASDGLTVNNVSDHRRLSRYHNNFTAFANDGLYVTADDGSGHRQVGIIKLIRHVNKSKCTMINDESMQVNRKAYF